MGIHTCMYRASMKIYFPLKKKQQQIFKTLFRLKSTNAISFFVLL